MGQIIRFAAPPHDYPTMATALDVAERLLLVAIRWWVAAFRRAEDPLPQLSADMAAAGVDDAALSVDALMAVLARTARRTIDIHCPRCPSLTEDEQRLLHATSLAQTGNAELAERVLLTALLTAQGAELALMPIEGLGHVFAMAGLFFRRRQPALDDCSVEGWAPPALSSLLH
jgi:hypothetical protein